MEQIEPFKLQCAVVDNYNNHCPEKTVHFIEDDEIWLCEKCYKNYINQKKHKTIQGKAYAIL
ncbi:MAG: hypothetical protein PHP92_03565 [Candidatus Nanoarchaeia archaeon]|nr:hypothetical protein [Candidatus Nanoarchaeia archaeon]